MSSALGTSQNQFSSYGGTFVPPYTLPTSSLPSNSAIVTLTNSQSGTTFLCPSFTGTQCVVNLPAVTTSQGCNYKFVQTAGPTLGTLIITPTTSVLNGIVRTSLQTIPCSNKSTLSNITGATKIGDYIEVSNYDGVSWSVNAYGQTGACFA